MGTGQEAAVTKLWRYINQFIIIIIIIIINFRCQFDLLLLLNMKLNNRRLIAVILHTTLWNAKKSFAAAYASDYSSYQRVNTLNCRNSAKIISVCNLLTYFLDYDFRFVCVV